MEDTERETDRQVRERSIHGRHGGGGRQTGKGEIDKWKTDRREIQTAWENKQSRETDSGETDNEETQTSCNKSIWPKRLTTFSDNNAFWVQERIKIDKVIFGLASILENSSS